MHALSRDLFIAFRNVTRQKRRSAVGIAAVAFGVVALLEAGGFINWALTSMREATIHSRLGHVQIVREGYFESGFADPFEYLLPEKSPVLEQVEKLPGVVVVTQRLSFNGLISMGETTVAFNGEGMDPAKEGELNSGTLMREGKALAVDDAKGIVLGQGLAANLGVKVGERIALLATTSRGSINGVEGTVHGIFSTATKAYDDVTLRVPLPMARQLLQASGGHVWVLLLKDTSMTAKTTAALAPLVAGQKLQLVPWTDLADFYNKTVSLFSRQMAVVKFIIAVIIILCISNTLTMSVMERTGEIGTSMALGLRRRNILQQFVCEGAVVGIMGCTFGLAIGVVLAQIISMIGIPLPPPPGTSRELIGEILLTPSLVTETVLLALATTLLAAIYPAFKGSRMIIVNALRFNR